MKRLTLLPLLAVLVVPPPAWAGAEGPGTPQATAANATFLSNAPIPPTGRGVCVIDSGVDTDTDLGPALAGRTTSLGGGGSTDPGDFGTTSSTGDLLAKHGTYVAGIIASQVDGKGTSGIWPAAKIYSARVFAAVVDRPGQRLHQCHQLVRVAARGQGHQPVSVWARRCDHRAASQPRRQDRGGS